MLCPRCGYDNLPGNDDCTRCLLDLAQLDVPRGQDRVQSSLMTDRVALLKPRPPVTINQATTVREALALMIENGVGALLVVSADGRLQGILSERDLLMRTGELYPDGFTNRKAAEFMTPHPVTVTLEDTLARALQKMDVGGYRHLPVVAAGKPTGMISVRDLVRHMTRLCRE